MKEDSRPERNTTPKDKEILNNSMEIPPQKPQPTSSTPTPPPAEPDKTQ